MTHVASGAPIDLSDEPRPRRSWWPSAAWTAAVLLYALIIRGQIGLPIPYALTTAIVYFYSLALLMLPVSRASERLSAARVSTAALVAAHTAIGVLVVAVWVAIYLAFLRASIGPAMWESVLAGSWLFQLMGMCSIYASALGLMLAAQAQRRERQRERREAELLIVAREAELAAIKAQLQPHFVLNALNSVLVLIDKDPGMARTMVTRLSDLMKAVFDRFDAVEVPLERELELIRAYLDVERIRFGSRLSVAFDVDEASARAVVPAFLLQPIVENAVKHGIAPHTRPGQIRISARTVDRRVRIAVFDSGAAPAVDFAAPAMAGRGLQLTRRRLDAAYGDGYQLTFDREPGDGGALAVRIDLPLEHARAV